MERTFGVGLLLVHFLFPVVTGGATCECICGSGTCTCTCGNENEIRTLESRLDSGRALDADDDDDDDGGGKTNWVVFCCIIITISRHTVT